MSKKSEAAQPQGQGDAPKQKAGITKHKWDNYAIADAPRLGLRGWLRWVWRQVTSMRLALVLLLMFGLAAIPGSILPQYPQDPVAVRTFSTEYPTAYRLLEPLGFFDVYGSAWFTAIYMLLFTSLAGCIIPRVIAHWKVVRKPVAAAPRTLKRYDPFTVEVPDAAAAIEAAQKLLHKPGVMGWLRTYRVRVEEREVKGQQQWTLAAEKGHVREFGNVFFHLAILGILCAVAYGALFSYRGQVLIMQDRTFTNAVVAYDSFDPSPLFRAERMEPFTLSLDGFDANFGTMGNPEGFRAYVTLTEPGRDAVSTQIEVNRPLQVDDGKIYLMGNGYAPDLTFTDGDGLVALSGPTPFLPEDTQYTSTGVIKVPDVTSGPQIGMKATLYPSAVAVGEDVISIHPELSNPVMVFNVYTGNLGLDDGIPQNVYRLDESQLSPVQGEDGVPLQFVIVPGATVELPDGLGSVTWNDTIRYVALDLRADPSLPYLLISAFVLVLGLAVSLFGAKRKLWLVASSDNGTTVVSAALLAPAHDAGARADLKRVLAAISKEDT